MEWLSARMRLFAVSNVRVSFDRRLSRYFPCSTFKVATLLGVSYVSQTRYLAVSHDSSIVSALAQ